MSAAWLALVEGDEGAWNVSVPDLPGVQASGETVEDAIANTIDAIGEWMGAVSPGPGWTPPRPRSETDLHQDLDVLDALENGAFLAPLGPPLGGSGD